MIGKWFWQPDETYLNGINTVNLRSLTGLRLAVFLFAVGVFGFLWSLFHAIPWTSDPCTALPCVEPLGRSRATEFAQHIFEALAFYVVTLSGIAVGAYAVKRTTDTEHVERKELAKKAPVIVPPAPPGGQQTNVNVGDDAVAAAASVVTASHPAHRPSRAAQAITTAEHAVPEADPKPDEHEWKDGDPKAGII